MNVGPFAGDAAAWDRFVRAQRGWTHFHLYGWRHVTARVFGHECPYLAATADGQLAGVLPLVRVRTPLFGHYLISMPFVNYGGPLGSESAVRALGVAARALAERDGVKLLELRCRAAAPLDLTVSHRKITVVLDLAGGAEAVWKRLHSKVRNQVLRPQKEGVTVRFGADQLDAFYAVFARHMRDLGTPVQSRRLFAAIVDAFGDDVWLGAAYLAERPVAAGFGFRWGDEVEMTWASALAAYSRIAPNMLLYWSFIERAAGAGITTFNFGRCTPGSGTHRFKRQWGGRDEPLWWYQAGATGAEAATPSPDDARYRWGPLLWKHLPVPLATWLGPRIVRGIP